MESSAPAAPQIDPVCGMTVRKPQEAPSYEFGTWDVAQDGPDKVIMVDGRPWVASKDTPTKLLVASARRLYGVSNEELMDNARQFAYYPVAVLKGVDNFTNGTISLKFKTISGDADRASGTLFKVKPNGDIRRRSVCGKARRILLWRRCRLHYEVAPHFRMRSGSGLKHAKESYFLGTRIHFVNSSLKTLHRPRSVPHRNSVCLAGLVCQRAGIRLLPARNRKGSPVLPFQVVGRRGTPGAQ